MKKAFLIVLVLAGLFLVAPVSRAQEGMKRGALELGVGSDAFDLTFSPFVGYFFTDELEGIIHFDFSSATTSPSGGAEIEEDAFLVAANLLYNFKTGGDVVPALGAGVSYFKQTEDDIEIDGFALELTAAIRFFVGPNSSVNLNGSYFFGDADARDSFGNSANADVDGFDLGLSYSIFFS